MLVRNALDRVVACLRRCVTDRLNRHHVRDRAHIYMPDRQVVPRRLGRYLLRCAVVNILRDRLLWQVRVDLAHARLIRIGFERGGRAQNVQDGYVASRMIGGDIKRRWSYGNILDAKFVLIHNDYNK